MNIDGTSRWHVSAEDYDAWFDRPWGRHATSVEHEVLLTATEPVAGQLDLDAGCGTGLFARRLQDQGDRVIAIDRDRDALRIAGRRTSAPRVVADVHALSIETATVDVACAVTVCEFAGDPAAAIAELVWVDPPGWSGRGRLAQPTQPVGVITIDVPTESPAPTATVEGGER